MSARGDAERVPPPGVERGDKLLWAGMLVPPLAFLFSLGVLYAVVELVCGSRTSEALHIAPLAALAVIVVLGVLVRRDWRRRGAEPPTDEYGPTHTRSFMGVIALASSALFGVLLVAQWLAVWLLPHCRR
jgi:hypothetical protein